MLRFVLATLVAFTAVVVPAQGASALPAISGLRIQLDPLPDYVDQGQPLRFSGRLEGKVGDGWVGLPETYMDFIGTGWGLSHPTGADGSFATAVELRTPSKVQAHANVQGFDVYSPPHAVRFTGSQLPYDVKLRLDLRFNRWGTAVTGRGTFSGEGLDLLPKGQRVGLWYSADNWNWSMRKSYPVGRTIAIPPLNQGVGYYRLRFGGGETFFGADSDVVRVNAVTHTMLGNLKISAKKVGFGKKLTISGILFKESGKKWIRLAGKPVWLGFTCGNHHPRTGWYLDFGKVRTNARGEFKKTVKARCGGRVFAVRLPSGTVSGSYSSPLLLKVTKTPKGWTPKGLRRGPDLWS